MIRRGFTLIELLVVIGIVAVLAGLLVPVTASAWGTARRVACQTGLRSVGQAMHMYLDGEGRGLLPVARWDAAVPVGYLEPWAALAAHLDAPLPRLDLELGVVVSGQPWTCPEDRQWPEVSGFSWVYGPLSHFSAGLGRREVTGLFRADPGSVLALDREPLHAGRGDGRHNAVRYDGSVARWDGRTTSRH